MESKVEREDQYPMHGLDSHCYTNSSFLIVYELSGNLNNINSKEERIY